MLHFSAARKGTPPLRREFYSSLKRGFIPEKDALASCIFCFQNSCRGEEPVWVSCTACLWALSCIMWLLYSVSNDPELVLWVQLCRSVWYSLKIAPRVRLLLKWVLWLPREQLKGAGAAEQCSAQLPAGECDLCGTHVLAV